LAGWTFHSRGGITLRMRDLSPTTSSSIKFRNDNKITIEVFDDKSSRTCVPSALNRDTRSCSSVPGGNCDDIESRHIGIGLVCRDTMNEELPKN
jgi:hypothetical protein